MKKFIFRILILFCTGVLSANAAVINSAQHGEFQEYINKTGFALLNYNEIEHHIIFKYSNRNKLRGKVNYKDMSVTIPKGILYNVESEDELAAVIAHYSAYCVMSKYSNFSALNIKTAPKKYETLADKLAVDMLVKAHYSPLALITMINKTYGDKNSCGHVKTSVRLANIYEYITVKYPLEADKFRFKNNIYYQNFLLTSRKNREILQEKLQKKPTDQIKNKYR
ncbi:MAG: hypothetical protein K6C94_08050 [Candidatus Gastranaerophilales bacterium]|nr:hypothetical protein [Candidatus Gastranaerophilales bacterium]